MALSAGRRLGPYEVTAQIGAGGMGEVYRAIDTNLKRAVAIKVLPESVAADRDRLARFQREAEVLASLNHANIAAIYGLERSDGTTALAMELVEGPTLADRIAQGPIPLAEALPIAKQIAEALEAAHEQGIIHRDLKPANVKLRPDGTVKVLDFGLAKALGPPQGGHYEHDGRSVRLQPDLSMSPTITSPAATAVGVILGTAAYMSPEQARGKPVDKRADIFAFGCVLYEMVTAQPTFRGDDVSLTLAKILQREPDWAALPQPTPAAIVSLLHRCLDKDPRTRLRDIGEARILIEEALRNPKGGAAVVTPDRRDRERLLWAGAILIGAIAASLITSVSFRSAQVEVPEARFQIVTPPVGVGGQPQLAVSPDGRKVVFAATTEGKTQLLLRRFESEKAEPIAGTEGGRFPFWSPDSQSIGFFADQKLKRVAIAGGVAQTLADGSTDDNGTYGGSWNAEGTILFTPSNLAPLYRVAANGGKPLVATRLESPGQIAHRFPHFLPDGRHFLFFATGALGVQGVYLGTLDALDARRLFDSDTAAVFAPPDHVLFARQETLFAQRLDLETLQPVGDPFALAERVVANPNNFASVALSASPAGPLVYRTAVPVTRQLIWLDRSGKQVGAVGEPDTAEPLNVHSLSPDGRTVALARRIGGNVDLWLIDTAQGVPRRFTFNAAIDSQPIWSPDGTRIAFQTSRKAGALYDLYQKPVTGAGTEEVLFESAENKNIFDWSNDGRFILFTKQVPNTARDIWALPLDGDRKPFPVVESPFEEANARFSPDGRWIAYVSNESGQNEVYIQPFPGPGRNLRISTGGGGLPRWRRDGREIFYATPDNRLMAVSVALAANGASVEVGRPLALFAMRPGALAAPAADGQRFLINTPLEDVVTPPITVLLNWSRGRRE